MNRENALGSVLLAFAAASVLGTAGLIQKGDPGVNIHLSLEGDRFLAQETIILKVEIENRTGALQDMPDAEDLRNPQYSYHVTGPTFPHGVDFKPRISLPDPNSPTIVKVAPGEHLLVQLPLQKMFHLEKPGRYTLTAKYAWRGQVDVFPPIQFAIEEGTVQSARVMADDGFQESSLQRVLALAGSPPRLYQFLFQQSRPMAGEITLVEMMRASGANPDAREVVEPWANFNRQSVDFARFGWESKNAVGLETGTPGETVRADVPAGANVVHPALLQESGLTTLFVNDQDNFSMIEFPMVHAAATPPVARTVWSAKLPRSGARYLRSAIGPGAKGKLYALAVSQTENGRAEISLFDGSARRSTSVTMADGAWLLPASEPAMWVDAKGNAHAAMLVGDDDSRERISLVKVDWSNGKPVTQRQAAFSVTAPVQASVVTYSVAHNGSEDSKRPHWFALLSDGMSVNSFELGATPRRTTANPMTPLQLLAMGNTVYLVVHRETDLLGFEPLH